MDMSSASEGVALSHMLPVRGTLIGVGGPGGQQVAGREDTVPTGSKPWGVMGDHAADGHRGATGVQSSVSLGMGGSARSRDAGVANADGGRIGIPPFEGPGVMGELRALPYTLSEESLSDSIPGGVKGPTPGRVHSGCGTRDSALVAGGRALRSNAGAGRPTVGVL